MRPDDEYAFVAQLAKSLTASTLSSVSSHLGSMGMQQQAPSDKEHQLIAVPHVQATVRMRETDNGTLTTSDAMSFTSLRQARVSTQEAPKGETNLNGIDDTCSVVSKELPSSSSRLSLVRTRAHTHGRLQSRVRHHARVAAHWERECQRLHEQLDTLQTASIEQTRIVEHLQNECARSWYERQQAISAVENRYKMEIEALQRHVALIEREKHETQALLNKATHEKAVADASRMREQQQASEWQEQAQQLKEKITQAESRAMAQVSQAQEQCQQRLCAMEKQCQSEVESLRQNHETVQDKLIATQRLYEQQKNENLELALCLRECEETKDTAIAKLRRVVPLLQASQQECHKLYQQLQKSLVEQQRLMHYVERHRYGRLQQHTQLPFSREASFKPEETDTAGYDILDEDTRLEYAIDAALKQPSPSQSNMKRSPPKAQNPTADFICNFERGAIQRNVPERGGSPIAHTTDSDFWQEHDRYPYRSHTEGRKRPRTAKEVPSKFSVSTGQRDIRTADGNILHDLDALEQK
ncbi:MAG: hypothetical protein MHM6MM_003704 [Cercozoa sp. M6MM]